MTDPNLSNSYVSNNPDIPVRASANSAGKHIQHVRLDLGTGSSEAQSQGFLPFALKRIATNIIDVGSTTFIIQLSSNSAVVGSTVLFIATSEIRTVAAKDATSITLDQALALAPSALEEIHVYERTFVEAVIGDSDRLSLYTQIASALPSGLNTIGAVKQGDGVGYGDSWTVDLKALNGAALAIGQQAAGSSIPVIQADSYTIRVDEGATYTYIGHADAGALTSDPVWRIKRLTNADSTLLYPDGSPSFLYVWDDKASLTYL